MKNKTKTEYNFPEKQTKAYTEQNPQLKNRRFRKIELLT